MAVLVRSSLSQRTTSTLQRIKAMKLRSFSVLLLLMIGWFWLLWPRDTHRTTSKPSINLSDQATTTSSSSRPLLTAGICQTPTNLQDRLCPLRVVHVDEAMSLGNLHVTSHFVVVDFLKHLDVKSFDMLILNPQSDTIISKSILNGKLWEEEVLKVVLEALPTSSTATDSSTTTIMSRRPLLMDVGGNIGTFTLAALAKGARTITFEPLSMNVACLLASIERNHFSKNALVLHNVVSDSPSRYKMESTNEAINLSNGRITDSRAGGCQVEPDVDQLHGEDYMDAVTLDQVFLKYLKPGEIVDVMKVDVESFEAAVVNGALRFLCSAIVRVIVMEVIYIHKDKRCDAEKMFQFLKNLGYRAWTVPNPNFQTNPPRRDVTHLEWLAEEVQSNDLSFELQDPDISPLERMRDKPSSLCRAFE